MMETFKEATASYGKTYVMESDGRWIPTSSHFYNQDNYYWYTKASMVVQRSKTFAAVKHSYSNNKYTTKGFDMHPALTYDWIDKFNIFDGVYDTDDDVPCSVAVSLDTYITTGLYEYTNKTLKSTFLVNTANGTITTLQPMHVNRKTIAALIIEEMGWTMCWWLEGNMAEQILRVLRY